uniref:F-box domain-containing protein n=1 Tax=Arundo donax TaxID=35708 RepID=A0A0A9GG52_ARUDO
MALQGTEQGSRPPASAAAADLDPIRQPLAGGGMDCAKRSAVASLPDDALVEIPSRLHAKPLCRFKCVSKAWCNLIADRLRCWKLPLTLEGFFYGVETQGVEDSSSYELCSTDEPFSEYGCDDDDCGDYIGSEDGDEFICEDDYDDGNKDELICVDGGSKDADEGGSNDRSLSRDVQGHFINVLGRPMPLVDPSFSFLTKQPGIENITLLDSCNGLLLFGHTRDLDNCVRPRYIVCNPAIEHWVLVPRSGFRSMASEESQD